jgi:hypothetical protein
MQNSESAFMAVLIISRIWHEDYVNCQRLLSRRVLAQPDRRVCTHQTGIAGTAFGAHINQFGVLNDHPGSSRRTQLQVRGATCRSPTSDQPPSRRIRPVEGSSAAGRWLPIGPQTSGRLALRTHFAAG